MISYHLLCIASTILEAHYRCYYIQKGETVQDIYSSDGCKALFYIDFTIYIIFVSLCSLFIIIEFLVYILLMKTIKKQVHSYYQEHRRKITQLLWVNLSDFAYLLFTQGFINKMGLV